MSRHKLPRAFSFLYPISVGKENRRFRVPPLFPGRMALLVTLFLVLVNIFNSVTANAPKAEGLTAVETWVVMCILHVFCVLCEYAFILKLLQTEKRRADAARRALNKTVNAVAAANQVFI